MSLVDVIFPRAPPHLSKGSRGRKIPVSDHLKCLSIPGLVLPEHCSSFRGVKLSRESLSACVLAHLCVGTVTECCLGALVALALTRSCGGTLTSQLVVQYLSLEEAMAAAP